MPYATNLSLCFERSEGAPPPEDTIHPSLDSNAPEQVHFSHRPSQSTPGPNSAQKPLPSTQSASPVSFRFNRLPSAIPSKLAPFTAQARAEQFCVEGELAPWLQPLSLGDQLDELLPDGGLPRGAVVEIASAAQLGRSTQLALFACARAQQQARQYTQQGRSCWCAWIDPQHSLYSPGAHRSGVDLERLLVVSPQPERLLKTAVRINRSGVFTVIVIARHAAPGHRLFVPDSASDDSPTKRPSLRWELATRRLAMVASQHGATVILLSDLEQATRQPLPVALRLELKQPRPDKLELRVAKERYGRTRPPRQLQLFVPAAVSRNLAPAMNSNATVEADILHRACV